MGINQGVLKEIENEEVYVVSCMLCCILYSYIFLFQFEFQFKFCLSYTCDCWCSTFSTFTTLLFRLKTACVHNGLVGSLRYLHVLNWWGRNCPAFYHLYGTAATNSWKITSNLRVRYSAIFLRCKILHSIIYSTLTWLLKIWVYFKMTFEVLY